MLRNEMRVELLRSTTPNHAQGSRRGGPHHRYATLGLAGALAAVVLPVLAMPGNAQADPTVPNAPTNVTAVVGPNSTVTVTWTVGADGGDPILPDFRVTPYIGGTAQANDFAFNTDLTPGAVDSGTMSLKTPGT